MECKRRQVGQLRELFRDAAWHHPAAQNLKVNKNQHKTHALSTVVLSLFLVLTLSSFQARLKRRNGLAAVVRQAAVIGWRVVRGLQLFVLVKEKFRKIGQARELFRDAAWNRGTF